MNFLPVILFDPLALTHFTLNFQQQNDIFSFLFFFFFSLKIKLKEKKNSTNDCVWLALEIKKKSQRNLIHSMFGSQEN